MPVVWLSPGPPSRPSSQVKSSASSSPSKGAEEWCKKMLEPERMQLARTEQCLRHAQVRLVVSETGSLSESRAALSQALLHALSSHEEPSVAPLRSETRILKGHHMPTPRTPYHPIIAKVSLTNHLLPDAPGITCSCFTNEYCGNASTNDCLNVKQMEFRYRHL
ncbi:hypothetical protein LshimejAT787_0700260 [Lyophyllum shimeji]|uniref:Uncharacterized protein n=1 Tax=Lyophyllum shimeji TaxID=47721 RepID=A0A9P3PPQ6_LYOSH|nr:hypothetical protein LshimejAT787_0700260 [Lyophyllum shimeji]